LHSLTFKLTLWYVGLFGALSLAVFILLYVTLSNNLYHRVDENLAREAQEFEGLYLKHGRKALAEEFNREAHSEGINRIFFRLVSPDGQILVSSNTTQWSGLHSRLKSPNLSPQDKVLFRTLALEVNHRRFRLLQKRLTDANVLQIGYALQKNEALMAKYRRVFAGTLIIMVVCGGIVGWFVARRAMSGVERVTRAAQSISRGDLSMRVPLGREGAEIRRLALAFNEMLEKISALIKELQDVTNNIAHDLRSPLTRIRGIIETTLTGKPDLPAYREMASSVSEETDRLINMINTMLEIAQTEAGLAKLSKSPVDARAIITDASELFEPVAQDKKIILEVDLPAQPLEIIADVPRLQRAVANLLDNAIKYTPEGGKVVLSARERNSTAVISVADTGIGILEADFPYLFDRFYRGDKSRSQPGSGLGLSLAKALVEAHGGRIYVSSTQGKGVTFTISLPLHSTS